MEAFVDWQAFQRLDNANVVDFLTSTAGALCEQGVLGPKDADNLRLVLSGVLPEAREKPILLALSGQSAEFLSVLEARYGTTGFCLNLLRHTLRGQVAETQRLLAGWGQELLKRAELLFNRPVVVVAGGKPEGHVLASTFLVDFAETLAGACQGLEGVLADLGRMNRHAMAGTAPDDETLDLAVATALGFTGLVDHSLPAHAEHALKRQIAGTVGVVADAAREVAEQLVANGAPTGSVAVACEWLHAEAQRVGLVELPRTASLLAWEVRRRNLIAALAGLNEALRLLVKASIDVLTADAFRTTAAATLTEAARRRVAFDLVRGGVLPGKAWDAAGELLQYLRDHRLTPREVLPGEVTKINPLLTPAALATLVALAEGNILMTSASAQKSTTQTRARRLAAAFAAAAPVVVLALAVLLPGCGLKTRPQSDINDFRPDIPFRSEPRKPDAIPVDAAPAVPDTAPSTR